MVRLFICILLLSFTCNAQDTVHIQHKGYETWYIKSQHIPFMVSYNLTASDLKNSRISRINRFCADPLLKAETSVQADYGNNGYDRGHMMSAADNECDSQRMAECFYYSNMFPQVKELNRVTWEHLEVLERATAMQDDELKVYVGWYSIATTIGKNNITVPKYCWKVWFNYTTGQWSAWYMPNTHDISEDFEQYSVPYIYIQQQTGIEFKP